ncbi:MAG: transpeptidase family protein [Cryobacterium sp.]|nr:transpeptidase family protein [Oligoflexia bacterium]
MKSRFTAILIFSLTIAIGVAGRAGYIQIIRDPRLVDLAKRQFQSKVLVQARRGVIVDRNNEPLAINTEIASLAANPKKIQNRRVLARLLSKALGIPIAQINEKLKSKRDFVWIKRHIPDEKVEQFKKWGITEPTGQLLPGLWLVKENFRRYPHGELASQVLGTVNFDNDGTEGVELWQNSRLEGKVVSMKAIRDALGRPTLYDASAVADAKDGESIQLTIDASLQFSVEEALKASMEKTKAKAGSVIVLDAIHGDLLAVANAPTFDPNQRHASLDAKRNRVLVDGYEPGSTMKPILLATALTNGWKLTDTFDGEGGSVKIQGRKISEAETHEKFHTVSLKKMIQVSSNVVSAKLAMKLGQEKYMAGLRNFGFGVKTGTKFPGEMSGWLPTSKKPWQPLTLATVGFGQGIMVTPMQMARAYATFLNGGYLIEPRIVKNDLPGTEPPAPKRVISSEVAASVVEALRSVTEEKGTGVSAALEGYLVAGKTGTAQTVDPKTKKYSTTRYISSFAGFAVGVEPKIVILTMLDDPKGGYYAATTSAPLFRDVLNAVVTRFGIPMNSPDLPQAQTLAYSAHQAKKSAIEKIRGSKDVVAVSQAHPAPPSKLELQGSAPDGTLVFKMPELRGMTIREALQSLQGYSFQLEASGSGWLKTQSPEPGTKVSEFDRIRLKFEVEE